MENCVEAAKQACIEVDRALQTQTEEEYVTENVALLQDALHAECRAKHEGELLALWKVIGGLEVELSQCKRESLCKTAKIESELAQRNKEVPEVSGIVDGAEKVIADNTDVGVSREKEEWEKEKLGLLHDLDGKEKSIKEMQESLKEQVRHLNEMKGENAMLREESEKYRRLAESVKQDLNEQLKEKQAKVTALMLELEDQAIELAISKKSNQQLEKRMEVMEMKLNAFMTALPTPDRSGPGGTSDKKTGPPDQVHEHVQKPKQSTTRWDVGPPGDKNDKKRRR